MTLIKSTAQPHSVFTILIYPPYSSTIRLLKKLRAWSVFSVVGKPVQEKQKIHVTCHGGLVG